MNNLDTLRKLANDDQGYKEIMGPVLGAVIQNCIKDLLHYEEQIQKRGFALPKNMPLVEHTKGGRYLIVTKENVKLEANWSDGVAYVSATEEDGPLIIRNKEEFNDGRFKEVEEAKS